MQRTLHKIGAYLITQSIRYKFLYPLNLLFRLLPFYKRLMVSEVLSVHQYVSMFPEENEIVYLKEKREWVYAVPRYDASAKPLQYIQTSPLYIAKLSNAKIRTGTNAIITPHGYSLSDMFVDDTERRIAFSDSSFFGIIYPNRIVSALPPNLDSIHIDKGFLVSNNFASNYYHFTLEMLPCLMHVDNIPKDVPVLVDEHMTKHQQFRDLLDIFASSRKIEVLPSERIYEIDELYVPKIPAYIVPNIKGIKNIRPTDNLFDSEALSYLRNKLLPLKLDKSFPKRIFLYRTNSLRSFNQDEVWDCLPSLGFEKIDTAEFSILEQVTMFNQAEFIIGGSGAAFTNLIYCSPEAHALIITNAKYEQITVFSTLGEWVGMDLQYIDASEKVKNAHKSIHREFKIDPAVVLNRVKSILM